MSGLTLVAACRRHRVPAIAVPKAAVPHLERIEDEVEDLATQITTHDGTLPRRWGGEILDLRLPSDIDGLRGIEPGIYWLVPHTCRGVPSGFVDGCEP